MSRDELREVGGVEGARAVRLGGFEHRRNPRRLLRAFRTLGALASRTTQAAGRERGQQCGQQTGGSPRRAQLPYT